MELPSSHLLAFHLPFIVRPPSSPLLFPLYLADRAWMVFGHVRSPEQVLKYLLDDLNMTTLFLKNLPKVYWIWTHRRWCLDNIPSRPGLAEDRSRAGGEDEGNVDDGDAGGRSKGNRKAGKDWDGAWKKEAWERELKLVEKMLSVDARNCTSLSLSLLSHLPHVGNG
jgi:geranylgeranyl transferase type-2 subunit alpha